MSIPFAVTMHLTMTVPWTTIFISVKRLDIMPSSLRYFNSSSMTTYIATYVFTQSDPILFVVLTVLFEALSIDDAL